MESSKRKENEKKFKKDSIVSLSRTLLENKPMSEIDMHEIAKAAGYTKRTLYNYFKGKDEIFDEIKLLEIIEFFQNFDNETSKLEINSIERFFKSYGKITIDYYIKYPYKLRFRIEHDLEMKTRRLDQSLYERLSELTLKRTEKRIKTIQDLTGRNAKDSFIVFNIFIQSLRIILYEANIYRDADPKYSERTIELFYETFLKGVCS